MPSPQPWFASYESKRAATGFTQNAPGWAYFHRHHYGPGTEPTPLPLLDELETASEVDTDTPVICHCGRWFCRHHDDEPITDRPPTPSTLGLMGEFASYAWGLAMSRLRRHG